MPEVKSRLSLSILNNIRDALEREAVAERMDVTDLAEIVLERHVLAGTYLGHEDKREIKLYRSLVERVKNAAVAIVQQEGFRDSITADAIAMCMADATWRSDYSSYINDDPYKNGNPKKQNINPSFGYWVKKTLGAKSKTKEGKAENRKILGAIIQSYTPLEEQS